MYKGASGLCDLIHFQAARPSSMSPNSKKFQFKVVRTQLCCLIQLQWLLMMPSKRTFLLTDIVLVDE